MRYLFDAIMFGAGLALGIFIFQSAFYGVLAGAILAGACEGLLGEKKSR